MIRVALLGKWHVHARDYARQARDISGVDIAVVWDDDAVRGREWAAEAGTPFEADLDAVLAQADLDGVIVATMTSAHPDIIGRALRAGKHVFSEKVLALRVEDAETLLAQAERSGLRLVLSLPRLTDSTFVTAERLIRDGALGQVTHIRCRLAHNGALRSEEAPDGWLPQHFYNAAEAGGGALIDLGAHPIYLANRLGGNPQTVYARFLSVTGREVEDHAVVVVQYAGGVTASLETGFASVGSPFLLEIYGTLGTILIEDRTLRLRSRALQDPGAVSWMELKLDAPQPSPLQQWVRAIADGEPPMVQARDALDLTRVNAAAYRSAQTQRAEPC